jgi:hypothetical protein
MTDPTVAEKCKNCGKLGMGKISKDSRATGRMCGLCGWIEDLRKQQPFEYDPKEQINGE